MEAVRNCFGDSWYFRREGQSVAGSEVSERCGWGVGVIHLENRNLVIRTRQANLARKVNLPCVDWPF